MLHILFLLPVLGNYWQRTIRLNPAFIPFHRQSDHNTKAEDIRWWSNLSLRTSFLLVKPVLPSCSDLSRLRAHELIRPNPISSRFAEVRNAAGPTRILIAAHARHQYVLSLVLQMETGIAM